MSKECKKKCVTPQVCNKKTGRCNLIKNNLSPEQCNIFLANQAINPLTKKKIVVGKKTHKDLMLQCSQQLKEISVAHSTLNKNNWINVLEKNVISPRSSLKRLISPVIHHDLGNLNKRIKLARLIMDYIKDINNCLTYDKNTGILSLNDKIFLSERIGSDSVYGIVYMSKGNKGITKLFRIAIKMMEINNNGYKEIHILEKWTKMVLENNAVNLPITYKSKICETPLCKPSDKNCNKILSKKYFLVINELADGDFKVWIKKYQTADSLISSYFQRCIALFTFHSMGYTHNDAHWGNFLHHNIKPGGYWHYIFNNKDIFIKNTGQLWVLWDPGLSKSKSHYRNNIHAYNVDSYTDYRRILFSYIHEKKGGWLNNSIPLEVNFLKIQEKYHKCIYYNSYIKMYNMFRDFVVTYNIDCNLNPKDIHIINNKPIIINIP